MAPSQSLSSNNTHSSPKSKMDQISQKERIHHLRKEFNRAILDNREIEKVFERICEVAVIDGGYDGVWIGKYNNREKNITRITSNSENNKFKDEEIFLREDEVQSTDPFHLALYKKENVIINQIESTPLISNWTDVLQEAKIQSLALLPFTSRSGVTYLLSLFSIKKNIFNEEEIALFKELTRFIEVIDCSQDEKINENLAEKIRAEIYSLYIALVEQASDIYFVHDAEGKFLEVNDQASKILGYTREEFLNMSVPDIEQDFTLESAQAEWSKIEPGVPFTLFGHHKRKDGTIFPVEIRFGCTYIDGKKIFLVLVRDITEKKKIEESLVESETRFRKLIGSAPVGIIISDDQFKTVFINKKFSSMTGYNINDLPTVVEWWPLAYPDEEYRTSIKQQWDKMIADSMDPNQEIIPLECKVRNKMGHYIFLEISFVSIGEMNITTFVDVTDRKLSEAKIKESESKYKRIAENMSDMIWVVDPKMKTTYVSPSVNKVFGVSEAEFSSEPLKKRFPEVSLEKLCSSINSRIVNFRENEYEETWSSEFRALRGNDEEIWISIKSNFIFDESRKPTGILMTIYDITDRKKAEETLKETEERLHFAFEASNIGAWNLDLKTGEVFRNEIHDKIFGYSKLLPKWTRESLYDHIHPEDREFVKTSINESIQTLQDLNFECRIIRKDGQERWISIAGRNIRDHNNEFSLVTGIIQDITERKITDHERRRFSRVFEESMNEIYLFDLDTLKFKQVNRAAINNLGFSYDEILEMTPLDIKPEFTEIDFEALLSNLVNGRKEKIVFETIHQRKNGSTYPVEVHLQLIKFSVESMYVAIIMDISDRKKAEKLLNEQLDELTRWHNITLGREERILELKNEINNLLIDRGLQPKYASVMEGSNG